MIKYFLAMLLIVFSIFAFTTVQDTFQARQEFTADTGKGLFRGKQAKFVDSLKVDGLANALLLGTNLSGKFVQKDSSRTSHVSDTAIKAKFSWSSDTSRATHISDTSLHNPDSIRATHKADTSIRAKFSWMSDSARASHISDTSFHSSYSWKSDSSRASFVSDTSKDAGKFAGRSWPLTYSDVGACPSLSLTQNYIPKAATNATLGNSLVYDNGTYVGFGTEDPMAPIDIFSNTLSEKIMLCVGNLKSGASGYISFDYSGSTITRLNTTGSNSALIIGQQGSDLLRFSSDKTYITKLTPSVDIGYPNLVIYCPGSGLKYAGIGFGYDNLSTVSPPTEIGYIQQVVSGFTYGDLYIATRPNNSSSAPTERMRFTYNGLVGINKYPICRLDVGGRIWSDTLSTDNFIDTTLANRNYSDSTTAYTNGIRKGWLYHTNGNVKIMY